MLLDDPHKLVRLFIENLLWGRITANFQKTGDPDRAGHIQDRIETWMAYKDDTELGRVERRDFEMAVTFLNDEFVRGRIDGSIQGLLVDDEQEKKIAELLKQIESLKTDNQKLAEQYAQVIASDTSKNKNLQAVG